MKQKQPRYSIIIPARNGGKYLPTCVDTIISQDYDNYELIISDDHSEDGSKEYLATLLSHPNVVVLEPEKSLSMAEHWEWALSHARGEWLIFVGQDDGLQPYFFRLADQLTKLAQKEHLRTIMSERAYFFWKDCSFFYGDISVSYHAANRVIILNCRYEAIKALLLFQSYLHLPQMYTTSLFHRDILNEVKQRQQGRLFVTHPQDANLAAIACSLEKRYLMSYIPLGWVGSSRKSAGLAVVQRESHPTKGENKRDLDSLRDEYVGKIQKSELKYHFLAGDFHFGNMSIYFWQALLQTQNLRSSSENQIFTSKFFKIMLFSRVFNKIILPGNSGYPLPMFREILKRNKYNFFLISVSSIFTLLIAEPILLSSALIRKVIRMCSNNINFIVAWSDDEDMDIRKAANQVHALVNKKNWFKKP